MTPRLSGHFSMFSLVFFVLKSFLGIARQWSCEKFAIFSHKLRSHVRISIYRIERGLLVSSANWISPCDESIKKVIFRIKPVYMYSYSEIALIHDTRHVRTRFRVDGIKAMSLANRINRGRVCLHCQKGTTILLLQNVQFELRQVVTPFLIAVRTSTVTTASRKETTISSSHYLPLSSLKWNVLSFLFSRMNKLDRDFLPSVKLRDIAFTPISP